MRQMFTPPDYTKGKNFCLSLIISTIFSTKTFEKTIVLYNEQFYWTNDFSERLFCENMNDNFENKRFQLFDWKKRTNLAVYERWTNEMKKSNAPISNHNS